MASGRYALIADLFPATAGPAGSNHLTRLLRPLLSFSGKERAMKTEVRIEYCVV